MIKLILQPNTGRLFIGGLFVAFFLYFGIFNRYLILYLEQNQLFLYNLDFLAEKFSLPGGLPLYIGSFFTQFFISSWVGAIIITLNAFSAYLLAEYILKKHNIRNIIPALIPVWLLAILQSNEFFTFGQAVGFLSPLLFFALYISIDKPLVRYIVYFSGWPVLYMLTGGFSIPAILLCTIHELIYKKQDHYRTIIVLFIITGVTLPYFLSYLLYYIPVSEIFTYPVTVEFQSYSLYFLVLLLFWIPLMLVVAHLINKIRRFDGKLKKGGSFSLYASSLIFILMGLGIFKYGYNKRTELMLGIDYNAQHTEWGNVLKLSEQYPDFNLLVIYYTNLALYKTGNLLEKMFSYPQTGSSGLRLRRERSSGFFFGGEVFYYLSYTSEANRWAFETMIARGLNPRALKRLITTSIITGETEIAKKYLYLLNQTLFYRNFTKEYVACLYNPELADKDPDIARNRHFMIHTDFISNENDLNLLDLLKNHPENKMAYEYLLASLLLDKRLDGLAQYVLRLKDYGYAKVPVHIEEAILYYNAYKNVNILPEGFSFRAETVHRFRDYIVKYNSYNGNDELAAKELKETYGKTYWYFLLFINNK